MLQTGQDWAILHSKAVDIKPYYVTKHGPRGLVVTDEDGTSVIITFDIGILLDAVEVLAKVSGELTEKAPVLVKAYQERYGNGN